MTAKSEILIDKLDVLFGESHSFPLEIGIEVFHKYFPTLQVVQAVEQLLGILCLYPGFSPIDLELATEDLIDKVHEAEWKTRLSNHFLWNNYINIR